jgi:hypothetical protein
MLGGVGNDFHPASADTIYARHHRKGIRIFPGANVNDEPGGREIFCKLAAQKSPVFNIVDKTSPVSQNPDWLRA